MTRHAARNPWIGINYIPDNPKMAIPPPYCLLQLYNFDDQLVVLPSRYKPFSYVLARRQRRALNPMNQILIDTCTQPDTRMCLQNRLVPVSMIFRRGSGWNMDGILRDLAARDTWRVGGGEAAADLMDAADEAKRQKIKADIRDDMWNRSGAAYRSYKARTGSRVNPGGTAAQAARRERGSVSPIASSSGSTAGSGITITG